jgi:hypothetical protein
MRPISRSGTLQDFLPRPGDPRPTIGNRNDSSAQKWGGRFLLSNDPVFNAQGVKNKVTLIATGDLGIPTPLSVQLRFAPNIATSVGGVPPKFTHAPLLPFKNAVVGGVNRWLVTVRRGIDQTTPITEDQYNLFIGVPSGDTLPFDVATVRSLGVDIEATTLLGPGLAWVEAVVAPVAHIGAKNVVHPWDIVSKQSAHALAASQVVLVANQDRAQFYLCNTSTNSDMLIGFISETPDQVVPAGSLPAWPATRGAFVLPQNMFAVYESPTGNCFKGHVAAVRSGAGDGFLLATEGTVF